MLGEFGYSEAKESREEGMVVLAVEVREVRRIEWKQAKRSVRLPSAWLVHSLQPRSQIRFREKNQALRQDRKTLKTCTLESNSFIHLPKVGILVSHRQKNRCNEMRAIDSMLPDLKSLTVLAPQPAI